MAREGLSAEAGSAADLRRRGREDGRQALRLRLAGASADYIDGALQNPALGREEVVLLLRNRAVPAEVLARIGRDRRLTRYREVRAALVEHPRTPFVIARNQLPHLFWRDLAAVSANVRLSPVVRRDADAILGRRLPELALGEAITLARVAGRGLVTLLRDEGDPRVLRALAGNPRATEADVVRMAARKDAPPAFLEWVAGSSHWCVRRGVRLAVLRHPRTPAPAALRLVARIPRSDLEILRRDPAVPRLVRVAVERRALSRSAPVRPAPTDLH
jgi:hypothetical protein